MAFETSATLPSATPVRTRRPLGQMILDSLTTLQKEGTPYGVTAREITNHLQAAYHVTYPIQTVLVVLNRLASRGDVTRVQHPRPNARHRYAFYLCETPKLPQEDRLMGQFQAMADEFCEGNLQLLLFSLQKILLQRFTENDSAASAHYL